MKISKVAPERVILIERTHLMQWIGWVNRRKQITNIDNMMSTTALLCNSTRRFFQTYSKSPICFQILEFELRVLRPSES